MKVTFPSPNDKALAIQAAKLATVDARSQMYLYMLEEASIEGQEPLKVAEESLVDESIEQIKPKV